MTEKQDGIPTVRDLLLGPSAPDAPTITGGLDESIAPVDVEWEIPRENRNTQRDDLRIAHEAEVEEARAAQERQEQLPQAHPGVPK